MLFCVEKALQKVMKQKGVVTEDQGIARGGRSKSDPTMGVLELLLGKKSSRVLPSSPCDCR